MGVLRDVFNSAVRRRNRGTGDERDEDMSVFPTEPEALSSNSEENKPSKDTSHTGENGVRTGKIRATEEETSSDTHENIARKSDDSGNPSKTSSDSESDISRERRGRSEQKQERNLGLWERL